MATKSGNGSTSFYRNMLRLQFEGYLKIAVRKHSLPTEILAQSVGTMSNEELIAAIAVLRDLAHLPPE